jgi:hypothetical protein
MTFKVGDKVRRGADWLNFADWCEGDRVLTVSWAEGTSVAFHDVADKWMASKFELVEEAPPFKTGDKVRRKEKFVDSWSHGSQVLTVRGCGTTAHGIKSTQFEEVGGGWDTDRSELVQRVAEKYVPDGLNPGCGKFEPVYEPVTPPKAHLTARTDVEIGPFVVQAGSRTNLSAVDTLNRLWFNDPVGQKLNQIEIEYKESPDMTDDQLVQKILIELESMEQVTRVLISWKSRPNGIAWDRD